MIEVVVPGIPAPQGSKNQFGAEANPRTRPWRAAVAAEAARAMNTAPPGRDPVFVTATFTFPRPKSHYGTGRNSGKPKRNAPTHMGTGPDLDKLCRAIGDALTGVVVHDDRLIAGWLAVKRYGETAGCKVTVEPIEGVWEIGQIA